jgi:hypothetical protein
MIAPRLSISGALLVAALSAPAIASPFAIPGTGAVISVERKSMVALRFDNVVRQQYDLSCGAAALATLLRYYYGQAVGENELVKDMIKHGEADKIRKLGFSMLELKRYGDRNGYVVRGFKIEKVESLEKLKVPVLTLITTRGYGHFVVLKGARDGEVFIADPAFGNRSYSYAEFQKNWGSIILVFLSRKLAPNNKLALTASLRAPVSGLKYLFDQHLVHIRPMPGEF